MVGYAWCVGRTDVPKLGTLSPSLIFADCALWWTVCSILTLFVAGARSRKRAVPGSDGAAASVTRRSACGGPLGAKPTIWWTGSYLYRLDSIDSAHWTT